MVSILVSTRKPGRVLSASGAALRAHAVLGLSPAPSCIRRICALLLVLQFH